MNRLRRSNLPFFAVALAGLLLAGCASYTALSTDDMGAVERQLNTPRANYLRVSCYVTPFFGDASKKLLIDLPPSEEDLLDNPDGTPIRPGPVERILPAGTRVHIVRFEFPTAMAVASRILYTPRTVPWVYLQVEGAPQDVPYILVLRQGLKTKADVLTDVEQYVAQDDPGPKLATYSDAVQDAVRAKRAVPDMPADALEAAWGYPQRKQITIDNGVRSEVWTYPGGKRKAYLTEGRLTRTEDEAS